LRSPPTDFRGTVPRKVDQTLEFTEHRAPTDMILRCFLVGAAALFATTACSGGGPRVPAGGPNIGAPEVPWAKKSHDERQGFMAAHI
jgi:hypothetical protein